MGNQVELLHTKQKVKVAFRLWKNEPYNVIAILLEMMQSVTHKNGRKVSLVAVCELNDKASMMPVQWVLKMTKFAWKQGDTCETLQSAVQR